MAQSGAGAALVEQDSNYLTALAYAQMPIPGLMKELI
jgi:hypothetical protein